MDIAIVTGASSGLGAQFARTIAESRLDVDEIWLVARRRERLEELAASYPERVFRCIELDLGDRSAHNRLAKLLAEEKPTIKVLINNAGYEKSGSFAKMDYADIQAILEVNVLGATLVQHACAPYIARGGFSIVTCSISSFSPLPGQAVYAASKRYIYALGRALREESISSGANVMLLCPGNMDTEMNPRGQGRQSERVGKLPYLDMERIVRRSLVLATRGRGVYTPGLFYKGYRAFARVMPSALCMAMARRFF